MTWVGGSTQATLFFPIYRARAVYEHRAFFSAHTQNGKLADHIYSEFDKVYWIRIGDYTFKTVKKCIFITKAADVESKLILTFMISVNV